MKTNNIPETWEKVAKNALSNKDGLESSNPENHIEEPSSEFEAHHNLIGLFDILLQVGRRVNPEKYGNLKIDMRQTSRLEK